MSSSCSESPNCLVTCSHTDPSTPITKINKETFKKLTLSARSKKLENQLKSQLLSNNNAKNGDDCGNPHSCRIRVKDFAKISNAKNLNTEINGKTETNNKNNHINKIINVNNIMDIVDQKLNNKTNVIKIENDTGNACNKISNEILIISSDEEDFNLSNNNNSKCIKSNILKRKRVTNKTEELKSKRKQSAKLAIKDFYENTKTNKKKIITKESKLNTVNIKNNNKGKCIVNNFKNDPENISITKKKKSPKRLPIEKIIIARKLTKNTNLKWITNKYHSDDQSRITNFFPTIKNNNKIGYFETFKRSDAPIIITGDLELHKFLDVTLIDNDFNENNINEINLSSSTEIVDLVSDIEDDNLNIDKDINIINKKSDDIINCDIKLEKENTALGSTSNKLIKNLNENIEIPNQFMSSHSIKKQLTTTTNKIDEQNLIIAKPKIIKRRKNIVCPDYKIISGTNFAVDAFRFGYIDSIEHYFLTHFHADHYIGLKKNFSKPLYVSQITANLIEAFIKVDKKYIKIINTDETFKIDMVEITALNANHCPGAIMLFFKLPDNSTILHTGDFRASPEMESYNIFWNNNVDSIYLDTTYLSSNYDFKSQNDSMHYVIEECEKFKQKHIGDNVLVVCGSYTIGKEKVWINIAQKFNLKIWCEPIRRKAIDCIQDNNLNKYLVDRPEDAQLHVLTLGNINYQYLSEYLKNYQDYFTSMIAFRPTGWEKNSKPSYGQRITIIGVEYSEHSSYSELERFIRYLKPKEVISTVPTSGKNVYKTQQIPIDWLRADVQPKRMGYQQSITNFFVHHKKNSIAPPQSYKRLNSNVRKADNNNINFII